MKQANFAGFCLGIILLGVQTGTATASQMVAGGVDTSFLLSAKGELSSWGRGGWGTLGTGNSMNQYIPVTVPFPAGVQAWKAIAASECALAIADNNQLFGWGFVNVPPYTNGPIPLSPSPITSPDGSGWTRVAAGRNAWLALSGSGKLFGFRSGYYGTMIQYPSPPIGTRWTNMAMGMDAIVTIADSGRLYYRRIYNESSPWTLTEVPRPAGVTAWTNVSAGNYHYVAQANDGALYSWGLNGAGQLGIGTTAPQAPLSAQRVVVPAGVTGWRMISCGLNYTLALSDAGEVYAWGLNEYGELGSQNEYQSTMQKVAGLSNVVTIATGPNHSLAVVGCSVFGWGMNNFGQLGNGSTQHASSPVMAAFNFDPCATNTSTLPVVSILAADNVAAEDNWLRVAYPFSNSTNRAAFAVSRLNVGIAPLVVNYSISGTAANGVDYVEIPASVTIPAGANSTTTVITAIPDSLSEGLETVRLTLLSDSAYALSSTTNAVISIIDFESYVPPQHPGVTVAVPAPPTSPAAQVFAIQASTNLINWVTVGTGTNGSDGRINFTDTNSAAFPSRFFRSVSLNP